MWIKKLALGRMLLLPVILVLVGVTVSGCAPIGGQPRGWSGGTIADGTLFFGSMKGKLVALNTSDGSLLWNPFTLETSRPSGGFGCAPASTTVAIYGTPAVAEDLVYVGGYSGKIYAINSDSGALRWVYPREGNFEPVIGGLEVAWGKVYIGGSDGKVYALDAETGDWKWDFQTGGKIWSTPAIDRDTLFIGSFDKKLYALNAENGSKRWEFKTEGAIVSTPVVYNNTVYFGSFDRHLYAVDATDGSLEWKSEVEAGSWFWTRPVAFNNIVYAPCLDGKVYALNAESGHEVVNAIDLGSPVSSSPVLVDSSIIIATEGGKIYSLDTGNNQKRQLADVKELADEELIIYSPLVASEGIVYVHAQTKKYGSLVYALDAQTGVAKWHYSTKR